MFNEALLFLIHALAAMAVMFGLVEGNDVVIGIGIGMLIGSFLMNYFVGHHLIEPSAPRAACSPVKATVENGSKAASTPRDDDGPKATDEPVAETPTSVSVNRPANTEDIAPSFWKTDEAPEHKSASVQPVVKLSKHKYLYRSMLIYGIGSLHLDLPYGLPYGDKPGEIPYCRWFGVGYYGPNVDPYMPHMPQCKGHGESVTVDEIEQIVLPLVTGYIDRYYDAFGQYVPRTTAILEKRYAEEEKGESQSCKASAATTNKGECEPLRKHGIFGVFPSEPYVIRLYANGWVGGAIRVDE